jgi:threonine dehydrogenase-like Zn-dependent dehydrogenase
MSGLRFDHVWKMYSPQSPAVADLDLGSPKVSSSSWSGRLAAVRAATDGLGADIVIDCSGFPETFTESLAMVRTGGVVIEAGTFVDLGPVPVNPNSAICTRNVAVLGIGGEKATAYEPSMRLMAANLSRYPLDKIVTHRFGLARAADALVVAQSDDAMQVVIGPADARPDDDEARGESS